VFLYQKTIKEKKIMTGKTILSGIAVLVINLNAIGCTNVTSAILTNDAFIPAAIIQGKQDYPVRKEIRQTFELSPNAVVEVSGIEGSVEVETTSGNTAEIVFIREAKTQTDFDCETINISQSSDKLVIRHNTTKEKQCQIIEAREHLKLSVPRSANLNFNHIEGSFSVGATEGFLRLNFIEGAVRIEQAQAAEISWIECDLSLNVLEINSPGITINNVEGGVDLGVKKDLNADLKITSASVQIGVLHTQSIAVGRKNSQLKLGTGGQNISISNIEGGVKIRGI
jgi:hypothetical protein